VELGQIDETEKPLLLAVFFAPEIRQALRLYLCGSAIFGTNCAIFGTIAKTI